LEVGLRGVCFSPSYGWKSWEWGLGSMSHTLAPLLYISQCDLLRDIPRSLSFCNQTFVWEPIPTPCLQHPFCLVTWRGGPCQLLTSASIFLVSFFPTSTTTLDLLARNSHPGQTNRQSSPNLRRLWIPARPLLTNWSPRVLHYQCDGPTRSTCLQGTMTT
jgi:hypothetical protein